MTQYLTISHYTIVRYIKDEITKQKYLTFRSYKYLDKNKFKNDLEKDLELFHATTNNDTNLATHHLQTVIIRYLDTHAPLKRIQVKTNYVPFLTNNTRKLQK